jgi:hypothetical protein
MGHLLFDSSNSAQLHRLSQMNGSNTTSCQLNCTARTISTDRLLPHSLV